MFGSYFETVASPNYREFIESPTDIRLLSNVTL
jgi:hypothetical protein